MDYVKLDKAFAVLMENSAGLGAFLSPEAYAFNCARYMKDLVEYRDATIAAIGPFMYEVSLQVAQRRLLGDG